MEGAPGHATDSNAQGQLPAGAGRPPPAVPAPLPWIAPIMDTMDKAPLITPDDFHAETGNR